MNVSVKGARNNNEDAIYADGQMFAVYDGHAGEKVAKHLAQELPGRLSTLKRFDDESLWNAVLDFDQDIGKQE